MPIISLTSDYGTKDYRVAAIKASLHDEDFVPNIIDLSHKIKAFHLLETALMVKGSYTFFPKGTVHMICVDSFYHKQRKLLAIKADGHYFLMADNGLAGLLFHDIQPEEIYEILLNNRFDDEVSFTATDVFCPVAKHLAKGGQLSVIGRPISDYVKMVSQKAVFNDTESILVGEVVMVDHFGNAISNISKELFTTYQNKYKQISIKLRNYKINQIQKNYSAIVTDWSKEVSFHGKAGSRFNHIGLLEIFLYKGSKENGASSLLGLGVGEKIYIEFSK
jgi:S-adenosyl-L-methionine hydrolase (adenosine-forming)